MFLCFRYDEYQRSKPGAVVDAETMSQRSAVDFFGREVPNYKRSHPKQINITESIVMDLMVQCNLPFTLVEHPSFRKFLSVCDNQYSYITNKAAVDSLKKHYETSKENLKAEIRQCDGISVTLDIWSDRKMRAFLGVTGHFIVEDESCLKLQTKLLSCERIFGRHTGDQIRLAFETVVEEYSIRDRIDYIVTDNAANMKKAFTAAFPSDDPQKEVGASSSQAKENATIIENEELWECLPDDEEIYLAMFVEQTAKRSRLPCFTHTLQLCVADSLKETDGMRQILSKCSRICSLLHTSTSFRENFEAKFGKQIGIPAVNVTRWNSTFRQLKAIIGLDQVSLNEILDSQGSQNQSLTAMDLNKLQELVSVLDLFADATDLTQGDKTVTLSLVLPCILSIYKHLEDLRPRFCAPLVRKLQDSLKKRFQNIFDLVASDRTSNSSTIYLMATVLDPAFGITWTESLPNEYNPGEETSDILRRRISRKLIF